MEDTLCWDSPCVVYGGRLSTYLDTVCSVSDPLPKWRPVWNNRQKKTNTTATAEQKNQILFFFLHFHSFSFCFLSFWNVVCMFGFFFFLSLSPPIFIAFCRFLPVSVYSVLLKYISVILIPGNECHLQEFYCSFCFWGEHKWGHPGCFQEDRFVVIIICWTIGGTVICVLGLIP